MLLQLISEWPDNTLLKTQELMTVSTYPNKQFIQSINAIQKMYILKSLAKKFMYMQKELVYDHRMHFMLELPLIHTVS